ncbi:MAG: hypothetical protein JO075_07750, partial [Acidimicrobiia bacterium]|nr:hypothetical protein [Acidimicrobiia bacterium]
MAAPTVQKGTTPAAPSGGAGGGGNGASYISRPAGNVTSTQRLLRGYGPAVAIAAIIALIAILVPSKPQKVVNAASGNTAGNEAGLGDNGTGGNAAAGPAGAAAGTAGATGTQGQAGAAGKTVTLPGHTTACAGQALQVPGDPYSPPCILFSGDNGGATSKGVTGSEIHVAVRLTTDQSFQQTLAKLAGASLRDTNDDNVRTIKALAQYFNTHFNFYGRKLKIVTYTGQGSLAAELQGNGQAQALADATTVGSQMNAFADITAESEPYATALQQKGVLGFGDPYMPGYWHSSHAPYDWSLATDGTDLATDVANYAVQKLCPPGTPAAYAGGSLKGQGRKFAGIAPSNELYQVSATVFKQIMEAHGCAVDNYSYTLDLGTESQQAQNLVSQLKSKGYTTILCGCDPIFPVYLTGQEASQSYIPEFVEIGAALVDQDYVGQLYNQQAYAHAFGISPNAPTVPYTQTIGYEAYKQVDPSGEPAFFANIIYLQMDMMAMGIQMAGPHLTPQSFQSGMFNFKPALGPAGLWG